MRYSGIGALGFVSSLFNNGKSFSFFFFSFSPFLLFFFVRVGSSRVTWIESCGDTTGEVSNFANKAVGDTATCCCCRCILLGDGNVLFIMDAGAILGLLIVDIDVVAFMIRVRGGETSNFLNKGLCYIGCCCALTRCRARCPLLFLLQSIIIRSINVLTDSSL